MLCPKCYENSAQVIDTRPREDNYIYRRRVCNKCKHRWSTTEIEVELLKQLRVTHLRWQQLMEHVKEVTHGNS